MLDLSRLTPAPWHLCGEYSFKHYNESLGQVWDDDSVNREFIVLARNAFDVMMQRGWTPYLSLGKWSVTCPPPNHVIFYDWPNFWHPDPLTALVEADKWYEEKYGKT